MITLLAGFFGGFVFMFFSSKLEEYKTKNKKETVKYQKEKLERYAEHLVQNTLKAGRGEMPLSTFEKEHEKSTQAIELTIKTIEDSL